MGKIDDLVTPVAEDMMDELLRMDSEFFVKGSYAEHSTRPSTDTTRKRLIAALLTAGEYDSKMPAVRSSRVASRYRRQVGFRSPGIGHLPPANQDWNSQR
jgi:hypothetical protein